MTRFAFALLLVGAPADSAAAQDDDEAPAGDVPACLDVAAIVRFGAAGYDHWVRLDNGCARAARCAVSTNVNPEPQTVEVAAGEREEVLTFRGSPARTFEPRVVCELRGSSR